MGIEEKQDAIESLSKENKELQDLETAQEDEITKLSTEYEELKKNDVLDKAIEKVDISVLKSYSEDYKKVQDNLEKFNVFIKNYVDQKSNFTAGNSLVNSQINIRREK